jgi:hypothetical protein
MNTDITPVQVYPGTANSLYIRAGNLGPPPSFYYQLQNVTVVPPVPEQRDPVTNEIIVPASPETTEVVVLKDGNINMTEEQWDSWEAGPTSEDEEYQLDCISANLGLTRA